MSVLLILKRAGWCLIDIATGAQIGEPFEFKALAILFAKGQGWNIVEPTS